MVTNRGDLSLRFSFPQLDPPDPLAALWLALRPPSWPLDPPISLATLLTIYLVSSWPLDPPIGFSDPFDHLAGLSIAGKSDLYLRVKPYFDPFGPAAPSLQLITFKNSNGSPGTTDQIMLERL